MIREKDNFQSDPVLGVDGPEKSDYQVNSGKPRKLWIDKGQALFNAKDASV